MNVHFPQVERKSQLFSYVLAALAVFTLLLLSLNYIRMAQPRLYVPSVAIHKAQVEKMNIPATIPAPVPPVEQVQSIVTPAPSGSTPSILVPQIIPAPAPSVP